MSSVTASDVLLFAALVAFGVASVKGTTDFIRAAGEEHQAALEGKSPAPLLDTLVLFALIVAFPIWMTFSLGRAAVSRFEELHAAVSLQMPESTAVPDIGTTAYTFTTTHTIVDGRTDCKWKITHDVNDEQDCVNMSTIWLTPGSTVYLRTTIAETSGTGAVGGDYCKIESVPAKSFSVRRSVDAGNENGAVTRWEIVYTFTLDKSKPSITPQPTAAPIKPPKNSSGPWGVEETTDETIGSTSRTVYWVPNGKSYHFRRSCPSLSCSTDIISGTLQEARDEGKTDPCNNCVK